MPRAPSQFSSKWGLFTPHLVNSTQVPNARTRAPDSAATPDVWHILVALIHIKSLCLFFFPPPDNSIGKRSHRTLRPMSFTDSIWFHAFSAGSMRKGRDGGKAPMMPTCQAQVLAAFWGDAMRCAKLKHVDDAWSMVVRQRHSPLWISRSNWLISGLFAPEWPVY
ncbi:hypothetical protein BGW80DRAFT_150470 [Lactifluus volemus]|nr:hypothetical protein BGW80DRAFT_150470 [Lactifluus volemus]